MTALLESPLDAMVALNRKIDSQDRMEQRAGACGRKCPTVGCYSHCGREDVSHTGNHFCSSGHSW